eukprot:CAMPEP_0174371356 /NCGR_PEP_ID=MMETSP0811_2-20130205/99461_1 /TAXON_ID=73025 ORGANISM="Eutreptiella gymnastica-like, Strain CCMP1594" /NCGR_SAMPLE_ID=MMETSP0811_2 /ASSEMBLY_ACC=CAM_ASM_000667 /LENGTH=76 /DNA_ID=CAMNT_0015517659 /DNA_START=9 /DNA_END=239 /DNA_ORIENTATION=-
MTEDIACQWGMFFGGDRALYQTAAMCKEAPGKSSRTARQSRCPPHPRKMRDHIADGVPRPEPAGLGAPAVRRMALQ